MNDSTVSVAQLSSADKGVGDRLAWVLGASIAIGFALCYGQVFAGMVNQWWSISMYSYAFLIPLISGYLGWLRRERLCGIHLRPSYGAGSFLLGAGLLVLTVGKAGGILALQQVSLMLTIPGIVLFLFGTAALKALWLPIAFLGFMIPIWDVLTDPLHYPFQLFSASLGVMLVRMAGIPVFQDGVFIHLPNITLEVARACSGVNYLIAVLATSIPLATIVLTDMRRRMVLVVLAVAVSALANSLRVALIGFLAYYDLSGDLHGPYHALHGVFVSMVGYLVIFGGLWALSRGQKGNTETVFPLVSTDRRWNGQWKEVKTASGILIVLLLLVGVWGYIDRSHRIPLKRSLTEFSLETAGWLEKDGPSGEVPQVADQALSRAYRDASGDEVHFSLSYFEAQAQGKELVGPNTAKFHANAVRVKANVGQEGEAVVNRLILHQGERKQLVLFWYDLNGRVVAGQYASKFYTAYDAMAHGRTNGAMIWISADLDSDDQDGQDRALVTLARFASKLYPALYQVLPHSGG